MNPATLSPTPEASIAIAVYARTFLIIDLFSIFLFSIYDFLWKKLPVFFWKKLPEIIQKFFANL